MDNNKETFQFTYSAKERTAVENIRKKYLPPEENKMERLLKLHNGATQKAQAWSLVLGILGALILGFGMSLIMTDLGAVLGFHGNFALLLGILAGVIGLVLVALAYPMYDRILKKERQRIAPEVLRLTDELMK